MIPAPSVFADCRRSARLVKERRIPAALTCMRPDTPEVLLLVLDRRLRQQLYNAFRQVTEFVLVHTNILSLFVLFYYYFARSVP